MVDNPTKIYNDYVRANLPNSMSYDTGTDRYDINNHSFFKFKNSNWYYNYVSKYGYSALSAYAVNGLEPALVFDFKGNYFRKVATDSTFSSAMTHTASSNATMVDSDGLLKWRPHNLMYHSSDLNNGWGGGLSVGPVTVGSPFGTYQTISPPVDSPTVSGSFQRFQVGKTLVIGATYGGWALVKYSAGSGWFDLNLNDTGYKGSEYAWFDVQNGVLGSKQPLIIDHGMIDYGDGWWLCWATAKATSVSGGMAAEVPNDDGVRSSSAADEILIAGTQFYRSDLGGMVDNFTYVPTTSALVYGPRVGHHIYNGSAWVNEGILHESEARTNLIENSNDLTNVQWQKSSTSITANAGVSPDGTSNANKVANFASGVHFVFVTEDLHTVSGDYTFSVYVASAGYGFVTICAGTNNIDYYTVVIDLSDGTKTATYTDGNQTGKTCTVEDVGGSYYRVSISGSGERYYIVGGVDTGTYTPDAFGYKAFSGDGTSGILVYGAQVEAGSTPSSYIPTAGTTVTRAADLLTVPAANLPYDNTNMSIQMDGKMTYADNSLSYEVEPYQWLLSSSNYINARVSTVTGRTGQSVFNQRQSTSGLDDVSGANTDYSPGINVPFNIASRHGSTFINGAHEGTLLTANTTPTILPDLSSTDLIFGYYFMGTIGQFRMWSDDLTDAGIAEATEPSTEPSLQLTFDGSSTSSFKVLDWSE